jgi:hypothetical protein
VLDDGVEVVRRLRAAGVNVPIALCSGNLDAPENAGSTELLEAIDRAGTAGAPATALGDRR